MIIMGIDPGPKTSGACVIVYHGRYKAPLRCLSHRPVSEANEDVREWIMDHLPAVDAVAIESVRTYGRAVGQSVIDTAVWAGRYWELAAQHLLPSRIQLLSRPEVCSILCRTSKARKSEVWQAVQDMAMQTGGGAHPAVGTQRQTGPLYLARGLPHVKDAAAVAVAAARQTMVA